MLLLLNPTITPGRRDLPLELYETELHVSGERGAQTAFVRSNYAVEVRRGALGAAGTCSRQQSKLCDCSAHP